MVQDGLERVREAVGRGLGIDAAAVSIREREPLAYQTNRLYDVEAAGRHLIAKVYLRTDREPDGPAHEHRALELLAALDLAPQPVLLDGVAGRFVVYAYLDGVMWDRTPPDEARLAALAALWLRVHGVSAGVRWPARGFEASLREGVQRIAQQFAAYHRWTADRFAGGCAAAGLLMGLVDRLERSADEVTTRDVVRLFCRSDPRFVNVIGRPDGRLGMVDWEDCGLRDPAGEAADLLMHPNQEDLLPAAAWDAFLAPYLTALSGADPGVGERLHLYLGLFPAFWLGLLLHVGLSRAQAGDLAGWEVNGLPANARLRRYLARALAWPDKDFALALEQLGDLVFFPVGA